MVELRLGRDGVNSSCNDRRNGYSGLNPSVPQGGATSARTPARSDSGKDRTYGKSNPLPLNQKSPRWKINANDVSGEKIVPDEHVRAGRLRVVVDLKL